MKATPKTLSPAKREALRKFIDSRPELKRVDTITGAWRKAIAKGFSPMDTERTRAVFAEIGFDGGGS